MQKGFGCVADTLLKAGCYEGTISLNEQMCYASLLIFTHIPELRCY